jgi:hypothetical protein
VIALIFGLASTKYSLGKLSRSGPGLFPLIVSSMLFILGVITIVRARFVEPVPLNYNIKNIGIIILSLLGFVVLSQTINMIAGIIFLVFFSTLAGISYSVVRNLKITAGLLIVALIFKHLLGLNLPLL